ncbi:MAG: MbnP family protein [Verrucomicrobiota bacterium]
MSFGASLNVQFKPQFNGATLALDSLAFTNAAGQTLSVSRLDFLLSDFALRKSDGVWIENTNWQAYASVTAGRTTFNLGNIPGGAYDRLRFRVGLRPDLNHSDPAKYPADHPLNANLNGLHWGWSGGYVFLALEGRWRNPDGQLSGYSFHLGNDPMLMTVELPAALSLDRDQIAKLTLHVDRLFAGRPPLQLAPDTASTHSRDEDPLALRLRAQVESAFAVEVIEFTGTLTAQKPSAAGRQIAPTATPYRFTFARHFPTPQLPLDNPLTNEGVELGRKLFHDPLLSLNGRQSCATCHQVQSAFTDTGKALSLGAEGQAGTRNAMPLFNLAWKRSFFWDGRAPSLREQVLMPIQNPIEMHETLPNIIAKLSSTGGSRRKEALITSETPTDASLKRNTSPAPQAIGSRARTNSVESPRSAEPTTSPSSEDYPALFARAFGTSEITSERVARAMEQFLLTLVSYESRFDRVMQGREQATDEEKRGFELFLTEYDPRRGMYGADCFHCHGGPFLTNHGFANNGLDAGSCDSGLEEVTGRPADKGRFAVPSLRNVALTAPYMHDGRFNTLEEVIEHYSTGVKRSASLDPNLAKHPGGGIPLSDADKKALVAFLKMLTDEQYLTNKTNATAR